MNERFKIIFIEEAREFFFGLGEKPRTKILFNIDKVKVKNDPKLFKKISNKIWEFRTKFNKLNYRLFAFWDKTSKEETLVISTHGIIKKKDKISKSDIEKAEKIRIQYFKQKR